jgi:hypothetical protein
MEDNLEINLETHLEEVHLKEIYLEDHHLIHFLDRSNGQHLTHTCLYHHGINNLLYNLYQNQQTSCHTGLTYVKNIDPDAHIKLFKKAIKANSEIVEVDIINLFGFTLKDSISKWGEIFVEDHPNCTFEKLE